MSKKYVIYTQESTPIDDYYVAYVSGWEMPDVNKIINMFFDVVSKIFKFYT